MTMDVSGTLTTSYPDVTYVDPPQLIPGWTIRDYRLWFLPRRMKHLTINWINKHWHEQDFITQKHMATHWPRLMSFTKHRLNALLLKEKPIYYEIGMRGVSWVSSSTSCSSSSSVSNSTSWTPTGGETWIGLRP